MSIVNRTTAKLADLRPAERPAANAASTADAPTPDGVLSLGLAFWGSKTLLSAVELDLFTLLAERPRTLDEIRAKLGLHDRSARDFLDALVALRMLERAGDEYSNTRETDLYLDRAKPTYVGGMLEMANARLYPFWGGLTEALRTGRPQNEAKSGGNFFTALYADPARLRDFLHAMTGLSMGASRAIAEKFPWADYSTFVDVGGAEGGLAVEVARAHPHVEGGVFDLAPVEPSFQAYAEQAGVADRLRFYAGDFFAHAFPRADVVVMGHILHDWNLEEKKALLRKAYEAVPEGGAVVLFESLIDDDRRENAFGLLMSLNMLIETPGGFDYTGEDAARWMREVGFREVRVERLVGPDSMVIGIK